MKLTDCFDRVHVINLPYKEDRRGRLTAHLREVGIADPDQLHWERAISGDRCWAPAYFLAGNGPWGCLQSHIRIAQDAIMDGIGSYLVLEDDAVFHPRAPEMLERLMGELPADWGQLYPHFGNNLLSTRSRGSGNTPKGSSPPTSTRGLPKNQKTRSTILSGGSSAPLAGPLLSLPIGNSFR